MTRPDPRICSVPGCIELADMAVTIRYARSQYLCDEHAARVRAELVKMLALPVPTLPDPSVRS